MSDNKEENKNKIIIPKFKTKNFNIKKNINKNKNFFIIETEKEKNNKNEINLLGKKRDSTILEENEEKNRLKNISENIIIKEGRWTQEEQNKFIEGIVKYGINWKNVKNMISTRTAIQVRSHAQKFYYKIKTCKDKILGIDFTIDTICNIGDMIKQIKSVSENYDVVKVFKYLEKQCNKNKKKRNYIKKNNNNNRDFYVKIENDNKIQENLEENNKIYNELNNNNDYITNNFIFNENIKLYDNEKMNLNQPINQLNNNEVLNKDLIINNYIFYINTLKIEQLKNDLIMNYINNNYNNLLNYNLMNNITNYPNLKEISFMNTSLPPLNP